MTRIDECPIWIGFNATIDLPNMGATWIVESPRAGGKYEIDNDLARALLAKDLVKEFDFRARARLTTWLVDQRRLGSQCPKITQKIVEYAKMKATAASARTCYKVAAFRNRTNGDNSNSSAHTLRRWRSLRMVRIGKL